MTEDNDSFKDRSGGLKAFGVALIVVGSLSLLMVPLSLLGSIMSRTMDAGQSASYWVFSLLINLMTYLFLGGMFLWIGIGSIRLKRWVRPVLLSIGWVWLLLGLMVTVLIFFIMPKMMGSFMPPEVQAPSNIINIVIVVSGLISLIFMVLLPGLLIWFYAQKSVKQTLEAKNPGPAWTDACPSPVLAISLFYGVSAALTLLTSFLGVSFIYGKIIAGFPAAAILILFALLFFYVCYGLYKLNIISWWLAVASTLFWTFSFMFTLKPEDMMRIIPLMQGGLDSGDINFVVQYIWKYQMPIVIISAITLIGYLIYIKKYFKRS